MNAATRTYIENKIKEAQNYLEMITAPYNTAFEANRTPELLLLGRAVLRNAEELQSAPFPTTTGYSDDSDDSNNGRRTYQYLQEMHDNASMIQGFIDSYHDLLHEMHLLENIVALEDGRNKPWDE